MSDQSDKKKPGFRERYAQARAELEARDAQKRRDREERNIQEEGQGGSVGADTNQNWLERQAHKLEGKAALRESRAKEREAADPLFETCGRLVARDRFGSKDIAVYEKGFVRIGLIKLGEPEKLVSISAHDNTSKKTGIGRVAAGVLTLGANQFLAESQRGDLLLVIVTDKQTYTLRANPPDNRSVRALQTLAAAGESVLSSHPVQPSIVVGAESVSGRSLAEELKDLKALLDEGVLSEEEFHQAKSRLLDKS